MEINENQIKEFLRVKGAYLFHRETQELEFKEQFNFAGLADYFRDFAAFANNRGGFLIFGVQDSPRIPSGLSQSSLDQFLKLDPEKITGFLLDIFSADIHWSSKIVSFEGKYFAVIKVSEAVAKPIIAKKDEGRDQIIKNGEIYYRYGGRTQKIQFAELENIINKRIEKNNKQWLDLMAKIGKAGPQNAAILDTEKSLIEKENARILVVDDDLAKKLKFIKEGHFSEKEGAATLKLVGDVVPIEKVEVVKRVKEYLTREYPLSAKELLSLIKEKVPIAKQHEVWDIIKETELKSNPDYSAYNFRNKKQEDEFKKTGLVPSGTPSIYKLSAVDFIINVLNQNDQ